MLKKQEQKVEENFISKVTQLLHLLTKVNLVVFNKFSKI